MLQLLLEVELDLRQKKLQYLVNNFNSVHLREMNDNA